MHDRYEPNPAATDRDNGLRRLSRLTWRSAQLSALAAAAAFAIQTQCGVEVLVAVQGLPRGTAVIRTFVPGAELRTGVVRAWLLLCVVGLGLLVLSVAVADQLARSLVRPLGDLARASDLLAAGHLASRAQVTGPPEVRQVSAGLNRLAERIGALLAHERETVADLSHRLRTPLTALRINAESLHDNTEMEQMLTDVAGLVVSDQGPGFADPDAARRGMSTGGSTGLGLDIARRIAETSGGSLTVGQSATGGGAVTVGLGPPAGSAQPDRRHRRARPHLTRGRRATGNAGLPDDPPPWAATVNQGPRRERPLR
jgi:signal transduction histidine kinase